MKWKLTLAATAVALLAGSGFAAAQTTITVVTLGGADQDAMQAVATAFQKKHPDITVKIQGFPWAQFFQVTELRLRSKDPNIDLVYTDVPLIAGYSVKGYLAPLDQAMTHDEAEKTWIQSAIDAGTWQGKLMAFPINSSAQVLYFNRAMFQKAGITPPDGLLPGKAMNQAQVDAIASKSRWTWEQVADAAKKLTISEGGNTTQWGFSIEQFGELYQLQPLGESYGKPVIAPDDWSAKGYLDSPEWKKAAEFWSKLYNDWQVSPKNPGSGGQTVAYFAGGQLAMLVGGTWNVPGFVKAGIDFGMAPHPYFAGGQVYTPTGSWYLGVSAGSSHKAEAIEFGKYLTASDEGTRVWFKAINQLPVTKSLLDEIAKDPSFDEFPKNAMRLGVYEAQHTAKPRPVTPAYGQLQDAFRSAFVDISNGVAADQALASAVAKFDAAAARMK